MLRLATVDQNGDDGCWLIVVYGPTDHALKEGFLSELEGLAATYTGPWLIYGNFNLIYQAQRQEQC